VASRAMVEQGWELLSFSGPPFGRAWVKVALGVEDLNLGSVPPVSFVLVFWTGVF
jgi:hypothetical protein